MSIAIFIVAYWATATIRDVDLQTFGILQYVNRSLSELYPPPKQYKSPDLLIVDLNTKLQTLADKDHDAPDNTFSVRQECADLIDSLMYLGARGVAIDIFFDPFIDTTGQAKILQVAKRYPNLVFAFKLRKEANSNRGVVFTQMSRHTLSYSRDDAGLVYSLPDFNLHGIELPIAGLAENAALMGYVDIFPENDGRIVYYPLFHRIAGVDSLFAGIATQVFRLAIANDAQNATPDRWLLQFYLNALAENGIEADRYGRLRIRKIPAPLREDYFWQNIRNREISPATFRDKFILIINSPTEATGPLDENYPLWGYLASAISQMLGPETAQSTDFVVFPLILLLYIAWVYAHLWPSVGAKHSPAVRTALWLIPIIVIFAMPFFLPGQNLVSNTPVSAALLLSMALFAFSFVEKLLLSPPEVEYLDLLILLQEPKLGIAEIIIQHAPVPVGLDSTQLLPEKEAGKWKNKQRALFYGDMPEMRALGDALYGFLMAGTVGSTFEESLNLAEKEKAILRLGIRNQTETFSSLPIELLRNTSKYYGYLALHNRLSIVHDLTADPDKKPEWVPPIRILVLMASPASDAFAPLEVKKEKQKIYAGTRLLKRRGWLKLQIIEHTGHRALEALPVNSFDIVHFVGHGIIDKETQSNCLILEGDYGNAEAVNAEFFGQRMKHVGPKLILLNACETGDGEEHGVFINIARELQRTTNAVIIAQQFAISDEGGIKFSEAFYRTFAQTLSPELALNRARQEIAATHNTLPSDWASPVYFIR